MQKVVRLALVVGVLFALVGVGTALAAGSVRQSTDVKLFEDMSVVGKAKLVRTNSGITMNIKSSVEGELFDVETGQLLGVDHMRGDATTNWWVVFNKPSECTDPCGRDDILNALGGINNDPMLDVLFATGHVAGPKWRAAAHLNEGDVSGSLLPLFGQPAVGLTDAMMAEVHVIVRSHGNAKILAKAGELSDAISSVGGGCTINTCGDSQFAVFTAP